MLKLHNSLGATMVAIKTPLQESQQSDFPDIIGWPVTIFEEKVGVVADYRAADGLLFLSITPEIETSMGTAFVKFSHQIDSITLTDDNTIAVGLCVKRGLK